MTTQYDTILNHLEQAGGITQREALIDYSIQSLPRRIADLREMGHNIVTVSKKHPTTGQQYAKYVLAEDAA